MTEHSVRGYIVLVAKHWFKWIAGPVAAGFGLIVVPIVGLLGAFSLQTTTRLSVASVVIAILLIWSAQYTAWKQERDARILAEADLGMSADMRGTISVSREDIKHYGGPNNRASTLRFICDCANHGRKSCQINRARLVFHPPNNASSFEFEHRFPPADVRTVAPGEQFSLSQEIVVRPISPMELQQCGVDVYLIDSVDVEYRNTVTNTLP
jgi:hypothetical protein